MTIRDAIDKGIDLVRMPNWNEFSYVKLPVKRHDGTHGPWAELFDPISAAVLQDHGGNDEIAQTCGRFPMPVLVFQLTQDDVFEEFTGTNFTPDDIRNNRHIKTAQLP